MMPHISRTAFRKTRPEFMHRQRGMVLFVALIAMVTIMLAAVGLMRSVDTTTLVAGNLSFRQAATAAGDAGMEQAMSWIAAKALANPGDPASSATHYFNTSKPTEGYYSYVHTDASFITADTTWVDAHSKKVGTDKNGNEIRYIIERMCRTADVILSESNCIYSDSSDTDGRENRSGNAEETTAKVAIYRVTAKVSGPKNTVSYIQGFVY